MIYNNNQKYTPAFNGITKIYALTDSHQDTRKTCALLSHVLKDAKSDKNVLFLNCGDMFKGIYPKQIEADSYVTMKQAKPDMEMVFTLGNNDFGFNKENLDFLINTIKRFTTKGIHTVCANIFENSGQRPSWLKPYTIIERDGDRTFVTGFCINNINTAKFGISAKNQNEVINEINQAIINEHPDNVVILNHDFMPSSEDIVKTCKNNGINVDLTIGGHEHDIVPANKELHIYYPQAFSESMYKMALHNETDIKSLNEIEEIKSRNLPVSKIFEESLQPYEEESKILDNIAPYTLNLTKQYSKPCPLGSFLADEIKKTANSEIAFFSTGFLMKPLPYMPDKFITNYNFKKTIIAETPIKSVELSISDLKSVFDNALKSHGYGTSNAKFLQCSNNLKIEGKNNPILKKFEVKQIYINGEPLLDKNGQSLQPDRKIKCAIDAYIADGGQGFTTLQEAEKTDVINNNQPVKINEVLLNAIKNAPQHYKQNSEYPSFQLIEL